MATTPLTPRQKMINMLYLVLTAILALNVSSEVLDAFKTVNDGISISNNSQLSKNSNVFSDLSRQYAIDSLRAREAFIRAEKARALSGKLNTLLEQYKQQMIKEAGGIDAETGKIRRDDDIDVSTRMFVENSNKGKELKKQIIDTRMQLLALLNESDKREAEKSLALKIDEPANGNTWEFAKFNHVPVVAAVTLLTKYQNDVLNAEGHVVERLYHSVNQNITTVDQMAAKIISPSSYILQGEPYKADVMVAASSSTLAPDVFLGSFTPAVKRLPNNEFASINSSSDALPLNNPVKVDVQNGLGRLNLGATATGNRKYTGVVRIKNSSSGLYEFYPFEGEYQVAPKTAVVSPKMMNVLYIGLENPVDISVPGVAQSDVTASIDGGGTLVKNADGSYNAFVVNQGPVKVKVGAKIGGKVMQMGEQVFRAKRIPDPQTTIDGISMGGSATGTFVDQRVGVVCKADFVYGNIPWKVQKFTAVIRKGVDVYKIENDGAAFNAKVKETKKGLKKGDAFFIDDVMVIGPDNKVRKINPLAYNITAQ